MGKRLKINFRPSILFKPGDTIFRSKNSLFQIDVFDSVLVPTLSKISYSLFQIDVFDIGFLLGQ